MLWFDEPRSKADYVYITRILPPTALLQLVALILSGLTQQSKSVVDDIAVVILVKTSQN
jgi:hypothetical protein